MFNGESINFYEYCLNYPYVKILFFAIVRNLNAGIYTHFL